MSKKPKLLKQCKALDYADHLEVMADGEEDGLGKLCLGAARWIRRLVAEKARGAEVKDALAEFVRDVNQTGGVALNDEGLHTPVADEDWIDLGETYVKACAALGVKPKVAKE